MPATTPKTTLLRCAKRDIPALIADNQMRQRDARFADQAKHKAKPDPLVDKRAIGVEQPMRLDRPLDILPDPQSNNCICPAGQRLYSNGSGCHASGLTYHKYTGSRASCGPCSHRQRCLRHPERTPGRQVAIFEPKQASPHQATERMKRAIDSPRRADHGVHQARVGVHANVNERGFPTPSCRRGPWALRQTASKCHDGKSTTPSTHSEGEVNDYFDPRHRSSQECVRAT